MGAWDYGIFDDDTAYDYFDEIAQDPVEFFQRSFRAALDADYVGYDECHAVTVSAAYLDNALHGTRFRNDNEEATDITNVNLFGELNRELVIGESLRSDAARALKKVASERSELHELWSDNTAQFPKWKRNLEDLIGRLAMP